MPTITRESSLETLIINWLTTQNSFEQGASADYTRDTPWTSHALSSMSSRAGLTCVI
ncbi:MAG: hypothetical protein FWG72_07470 [Oscillospiraceae bacterium]|nr:hypothetical protein [Oscillospiraceae bacterium]